MAHLLRVSQAVRLSPRPASPSLTVQLVLHAVGFHFDPSASRLKFVLVMNDIAKYVGSQLSPNWRLGHVSSARRLEHGRDDKGAVVRANTHHPREWLNGAQLR